MNPTVFLRSFGRLLALLFVIHAARGDDDGDSPTDAGAREIAALQDDHFVTRAAAYPQGARLCSADPERR